MDSVCGLPFFLIPRSYSLNDCHLILLLASIVFTNGRSFKINVSRRRIPLVEPHYPL